MIGHEAQQFKHWLEEDGLLGKLHPYSHAYEALPVDQYIIDRHNAEVREAKAVWYSEVGDWSVDDWIIGSMGNGDYYLISKTGSYTGVWQYHHELREKALLAPSLRDFYEFCISIEREAGNL
ncbi:hypothetical protein GRF61_12220 [Azoarcus sp. TTM-91]|uniref:SMI1/KNR4 family protein n=1 Tax=Azoarcus sp. TTM-91 TaxID=2691581 RepID=UPI00145E6F1B|nr:SMI1/KNR4 family protein [Azoarcus sp. TTM-91]NMG35210.1 hypothetical protein [Azoarcus sp. TTM-91]